MAIKDRDKSVLLDSQISHKGLFGDTMNTVVNRPQEVKRQLAAFRGPALPQLAHKSHTKPPNPHSHQSLGRLVSMPRPRPVRRESTRWAKKES